jgi:hypothetical protein
MGSIFRNNEGKSHIFMMQWNSGGPVPQSGSLNGKYFGDYYGDEYEGDYVLLIEK